MIKHLYLRRTPLSTDLTVVTMSFPSAGQPTRTRERIARDDVPAWIGAQLDDETVKAIYACHGCAVSQPDGCTVPWTDLPAGSPCERL